MTRLPQPAPEELRRITVNTVNPDDPARLIAWLATDEADWVTGQVTQSEGGFRR